MPMPSSLPEMNFLPPSDTDIDTEVASAASAFSMSSLTAEAGLSMTSPAAILLIVSSSSARILLGTLTTQLLLELVQLEICLHRGHLGDVQHLQLLLDVRLLFLRQQQSL